MWNLSQRTVIFITHDVEEAVDLSHIIYTLKDRPVNIIDRLIVKNYANNKEEIKICFLTIRKSAVLIYILWQIKSQNYV